MAAVDLGRADDPRARARRGSPAEGGVRELLVLEASRHALRRAVGRRAREPHGEVTPVAGWQRARVVVRAGREREPARAEHRGAGGQDEPVAVGRSRLEEDRGVVGPLPEPTGRRASTSCGRSSFRTYETSTRSACSRDTERSPSTHVASRRAGADAAAASARPGARHRRLDLDERRSLELRPDRGGGPRRDAGPCADIEHGPRTPVRVAALRAA